eukprot:gene20810-22853_t
MKKKYRGIVCCAFGGKKRKKKKTEENSRSDSEGSEDEETQLKRNYPRTLHAFPRDPERRKRWEIQVRRDDWSPSPHLLLCSNHFLEKDIDMSGGLVKIKKDVEPRRFKQFPDYLKTSPKPLKKKLDYVKVEYRVKVDNCQKETENSPTENTRDKEKS